uniref:Uncharacterized protein n=1 Tax=Romanomermis culicivorax TaxID=13658 RepID=A0A915KC76_ROMCU
MRDSSSCDADNVSFDTSLVSEEKLVVPEVSSVVRMDTVLMPPVLDIPNRQSNKVARQCSAGNIHEHSAAKHFTNNYSSLRTDQHGLTVQKTGISKQCHGIKCMLQGLK